MTHALSVLGAASCITVLGEVEVLLEKHARVGTSKKRWTDTAKFISQDINDLKDKLSHHTSLLTLTLHSLDRYVYRLEDFLDVCSTLCFTCNHLPCHCHVEI